MSLQSAPYWWLECDGTGCGQRCPGPESEHTAWHEPDGAEACAEESGWRQDPTGAWLCPEHPVCEGCGDPVDDAALVWDDDLPWHERCNPAGAPQDALKALIDPQPHERT